MSNYACLQENDWLGSTVSSLAMESEVVGSNRPPCKGRDNTAYYIPFPNTLTKWGLELGWP